jgi:hypothetical protein
LRQLCVFDKRLFACLQEHNFFAFASCSTSNNERDIKIKDGGPRFKSTDAFGRVG